MNSVFGPPAACFAGSIHAGLAHIAAVNVDICGLFDHLTDHRLLGVLLHGRVAEYLVFVFLNIETDFVPGAQNDRTRDTLVVNEGPVSRTQVFELRLAAVDAEFRMLPRRVPFCQDDTAFRKASCQESVNQRGLLTVAGLPQYYFHVRHTDHILFG